MVIGRQHDVAECMDNCMFQIETALLKFDAMSGSQGDSDDKTSVVKRYDAVPLVKLIAYLREGFSMARFDNVWLLQVIATGPDHLYTRKKTFSLIYLSMSQTMALISMMV